MDFLRERDINLDKARQRRSVNTSHTGSRGTRLSDIKGITQAMTISHREMVTLHMCSQLLPSIKDKWQLWCGIKSYENQHHKAQRVCKEKTEDKCLKRGSERERVQERHGGRRAEKHECFHIMPSHILEK